MYRYNGKELDEATGHYFYGFRMYDPAIGRFTGVDPIADQFAHLSVYNYASNDPIKNVDLHGLQGVPGQLVQLGNKIESKVQSFFDYTKPSAGTQQRIDLATKGTSSLTLGILGTMGGAAMASSTGGLGAFAGGTMMTMSLTEASIGTAQIVDAVFGDADPDSDLHKSTSGLGLLAHSVDSEYAELIDVAGEIIPGLLGGGVKSVSGFDDLVDAGKQL